MEEPKIFWSSPSTNSQVSNFVFQEDENISGFLLIGTLENLKPIYYLLKEKHFDHLNLYFAEDVFAIPQVWFILMKRM